MLNRTIPSSLILCASLLLATPLLAQETKDAKAPCTMKQAQPELAQATPAATTKDAPAADAPEPQKDSPKEPVDVIDHAPFDALLKKHVNKRGMVDYAGWKRSDADMASLNAYLKSVADADLKGAKSKAKLAFYINSYNALVISSVIAKHPIESVMKVDGFFKTQTHTVAGRKLTLDALENEVIRKQFKEPRIHFVLVCAAMSCPRLRPEAMTLDNVQKIMHYAAVEFINKASVVEGDTLKTSQLFNWFKDDFVAKEGSVEKFLAKYYKKDKARLSNGELKLEFTEYDWALNKQ